MRTGRAPGLLFERAHLLESDSVEVAERGKKDAPFQRSAIAGAGYALPAVFRQTQRTQLLLCRRRGEFAVLQSHLRFVLTFDLGN